MSAKRRASKSNSSLAGETLADAMRALAMQCLGHGMAYSELYGLDHGEMAAFVEARNEREKRAMREELAVAMALGDKILLGLSGKAYDAKKRFPELFAEGGKPRKAQTWQDQERILRRFLNMPEKAGEGASRKEVAENGG